MNKKIISISTKKGDSGFSYLASGEKLAKTDDVFEVLGTLDELNSHIGLVVAKLKAKLFVDGDFKRSTGVSKTKIEINNEVDNKIDRKELNWLKENITYLEKIQHTLFYVGAELAGSSKVKLENKFLLELEEKADSMQTTMSENWTTKFTLPGGTELGAHVDIARTVCRRCELLIFKFSENSKIDPTNNLKKNPENKKVSTIIKKYINRLSDYLYIFRCKLNDLNKFEEFYFIK